MADLNVEFSLAETVSSATRCECSDGEPTKSLESCRSDNDGISVSSSVILLLVVAFIECDG